MAKDGAKKADKTAKKKKGRQDVKRHWKPSLSRWVENYDRTGEHAKAREMKARRRAGAGESSSGDGGTTHRPELRRRVYVMGGVMLAVLVVIGVVRLAGDKGPREFEIRPARKPFVVRIDTQPATHIATADTAGREAVLLEAIEAVRDAAKRHPEKLIVIEMKSPKISFNALGAADQILLESHFGLRADDVYEASVARFLAGVLDATARENVAVLGLPVEPGEVGAVPARRTNRRYRGVLSRVDHLVSAHLFFRNDSTLDEKQVIEEAIPEALSLRGDRPVIFRQNVTWRALVDKGAGTKQKVLAEVNR